MVIFALGYFGLLLKIEESLKVALLSGIIKCLHGYGIKVESVHSVRQNFVHICLQRLVEMSEVVGFIIFVQEFYLQGKALAITIANGYCSLVQTISKRLGSSLLAHIIGFNIKRIKLIIDFLWIVLGTNRKRHTEKYQHDIYVFPFCLKQYPVHKFVL